jgi:hypothetical protein
MQPVNVIVMTLVVSKAPLKLRSYAGERALTKIAEDVKVVDFQFASRRFIIAIVAYSPTLQYRLFVDLLADQPHCTRVFDI